VIETRRRSTAIP